MSEAINREEEFAVVELAAKQKKHLQEVGARIKECRRIAGLKQPELAAKLGLTEKSIQNWEQGQNLPGVKHIQALTTELGTTADWLLRGQGAAVEGASPNGGGGVSYLEFRQWRRAADEQLEAMRDEIAKLRAEMERPKKSRSTPKKGTAGSRTSALPTTKSA